MVGQGRVGESKVGWSKVGSIGRVVGLGHGSRKITVRTKIYVLPSSKKNSGVLSLFQGWIQALDSRGRDRDSSNTAVAHKMVHLFP